MTTPQQAQKRVKGARSQVRLFSLPLSDKVMFLSVRVDKGKKSI